MSSAEFQKELLDFYRAMKLEGIDANTRSYIRDSVGGGGGLTGEFTLIVVPIATVAIVQARKLIETIIKILTGGTTFEFKKGGMTIKGSARDIQKVLTPERLAELLEASTPPKNR